MYPHLGGCVLDESKRAQLGDVVDDRERVPTHDLLSALAECWAVSSGVHGGRNRPRHARVGNEDAHVDRLGCESTDADLVQGLLHDSVQRLAGEAGKVDRHALGLESAFDVRAESNRAFGALADEHAAALPGHDQSLVAQFA